MAVVFPAGRVVQKLDVDSLGGVVMKLPDHYPFWMQLTEACWLVLWRAIGSFAVAAAIPAGVLFGLRCLRFIKPVVAP